MEEKNHGQLLTRGFVQAIPWAVVFSVAWVFVFNSTMNMLRRR